MKELIKIYEILQFARDAKFEEVDEANENGWKAAAQFASGQVKAYSHAINLLHTYLENETPFEL